MVWGNARLGSGEAMETALFKKPQHFPKFSYRDLQHLQELGDLLIELECYQEEGNITGLSYFEQCMWL